MVNNNKVGKTVRLRLDTVNRIDKIKPRGQSYDGFISTILDVIEQRKDKPNNINHVDK